MRRIVAMEVVSGIGDGIFWVGLAALLLRRGIGAQGLAIAALARLGPRAIISAPAGVLADRYDRRSLLVLLDCARGAIMVALSVAAASGTATYVLIGLVLASYTLAAPYRPAVTAALPQLAGEARLSSANALVGTVRQVMTFVGPLIGAAVIDLGSPAVAFALNAASFAIAAVIIQTISALSINASVRPGLARRVGLASHRASWLRDMRAGWNDISATVGLGVITLLVFSMYVARGSEVVLHVLVSSERLGLGARGVGLLSGAVGLGALCVMPFTARLVERSRPATVMVASVATTAVPLAVLGTNRSPAIACALLFVLGAGVVVFEVLSVVLVQRLIGIGGLGQVFGFIASASNAGKLVGALSAPVLVGTIGLTPTLVVTGAAIGAIGLGAAPALVRLARTTAARRAQLSPLVDVLSALSIFDGATNTALERVAASLVPEQLPAGAVVMRKGDQAKDLYIIRSGDFAVSDNGRVINTMRAEDWFGEIGLLQGRQRTATVTATTESEVWRIPGTMFLDALQAVATEPSALFDVMSDRLARSADVGASGNQQSS